jgi:predicted nucleotidyltransferase component of viral defense system
VTLVKAANLAASVHQRLLNLTKARGENFSLVLTQYARERFLYRLARSGRRDQFVLKGAMLFAIWQSMGHRATRDIDLLGFGDSSHQALENAFGDMCITPVEPDGIVFHADSIRVQEIREEQAYGGQRVSLSATLGSAQVSLQIDVGFGDVVTPPAELAAFPALLAFPAPLLRVYPRETVIAEKLHAMVTLGMVNSRMKDFYDVWTISQHFHFRGRVLARAIRSTFACRRTAIPNDTPVALTVDFGLDGTKTTQWGAFLRRSRLETGDADFARIVGGLGRFLAPLLSTLAGGEEFSGDWLPGGPLWVARSETS